MAEDTLRVIQTQHDWYGARDGRRYRAGVVMELPVDEIVAQTAAGVQYKLVNDEDELPTATVQQTPTVISGPMTTTMAAEVATEASEAKISADTESKIAAATAATVNVPLTDEAAAALTPDAVDENFANPLAPGSPDMLTLEAADNLSDPKPQNASQPQRRRVAASGDGTATTVEAKKES